MKRFLLILGLLLAVTAIKAAAWIAENGAPPSLMPETVGDMIGIAFVVVLVVTFIACSIWYLVIGRRDENNPK